jgi:hypothetical protein
MYRKLRSIYKAYWEGRRLLAKLQRWQAKLPKNRTQPEPIVPAVLREICASTIAIEFPQARHGVADPEQVRPLTVSAVAIDRWIEQIERA